MGRLKRPVGRPKRSFDYDGDYSMHSERYANPIALHKQQQLQLQLQQQQQQQQAQMLDGIAATPIKTEPSHSPELDANHYNSDIES